MVYDLQKPLGYKNTLHEACTHKYLLLLDGNSISGRSAHLFHTGSIVFKPDSTFSEFWYHLLQREYARAPPPVSCLFARAPPHTHTRSMT